MWLFRSSHCLIELKKVKIDYVAGGYEHYAYMKFFVYPDIPNLFFKTLMELIYF